MKKFAQIAALLLLFAGCSQDTTTEDNLLPQGPVKLTATVNQTRTGLNGNDVMWQAGDKLGLFYGTKFVNEPFTTSDDQTISANFTGNHTDPEGNDGSMAYAYYPYSENAVLNENTISGLTIPAAQNFSAESFDSGLCPMASANNVHTSLGFRTIGTVLKFQITGQTNVTKLELTGNNGESLAGDYAIDFTGDTPAMVFNGTEKTITLTCSGEGVALDDATPAEFHFVLPAGVEFTQGITIKVYTGNTTEPMVKEYTSPLTTRANKLVTIKAFTYTVPVSSIDEANSALADGTTGVTITSTDDLTAPETLEIPNAFESGAAASVTFEGPVSTELSVVETASTGKELPETLSLDMETTAALNINTPNLTVNLEGSYENVEAATAENTLIVAKNTTIKTLTVKKGNVKIYGTVEEIINEGSGEIIRCIDSQDEVERTLADTGCDYILIENPAGTLDFNGGSTDKQVRIEANVTLTNLTVSPATEHPILVSGNDVKLTLDKMTLICNAPKTYAVNLSGANPDVTVSNSEIITLGTDCRAISVINAAATSTESNILVDNTQARTTEEMIGNREYTDEEMAYFASRVADSNYYPRGIAVGTTGGVVNITVQNNSSVEGFFYAVNIAGITTPVNVTVKDSRLDGRAALNVHGQKCVFDVTNSELVGRNYFGGPTENFATIVLDYAVATSHSNTVTVTDSEIYSYNKPQTATNYQYSADIRSLHNTLNLKGSTKLIEVGSAEYPARMNFLVCCDNSTDNVINVDPTVTVSGKEGAKVLAQTVWDGTSSYAPAPDRDGDFPIYEAAELKWIADQINSGNYLYLEAKGRYAQVYLMNDIDLNNKPWTPMGCQNHSFTVSGVDKCAFYGDFHGTGHTISNINVDIVADAKGFIGKTLGNGSKVQELTLRNVSIPVNDSDQIQGKWVGALVGCMDGDTNVTNCHVENVTIYAPGMYRVGGLIGFWANTARKNATASIENCSAKNVTLTAGFSVGGLIGTVQVQKPSAGYNTIKNCNVENVSITHKEQFCWADDPNYSTFYPETGHYCYSSAPFAGDVNNVNFESCSVNGSCTISDADGHNTYMSATWTKLPYMGEVGGNAYIDGAKVTADPTPASGYFN